MREKYGGAPSISIRLDPEVWDVVKAKGGATWARKILTMYVKVKVASDLKFARHWEEFERNRDQS